MKHTLNHTTLWAKGWYKTQPKAKDFWKDLVKTLNADGWCVADDRGSVVKNILRQIDEDPKWWNRGYGVLGFYNFYIEFKDIQPFFKGEDELDLETFIIYYFQRLLINKHRDCFDDEVEPSEGVLPFSDSYKEQMGNKN